MSRRRVGVVLRLAGPMIQLVGIVLFLGDPDGRPGPLGVTTRVVGLALVGLGLVLVIAGLILSSGRSRRGAGLRPLDLDGGAPGAGEP